MKSLNSIKDTTLWKKLDSLHDDDAKLLSGTIVSLAKESSSRMKLVLKYFPEYTLHDDVHTLRVVELMSILLGKTVESLNYIEISLLILSGLFHDIGMVPLEKEHKKLENDDNFLLFRDRWIVEHHNYSEIQQYLSEENVLYDTTKGVRERLIELDHAILSDYLRDNHALNSGEYIKKTYSSDKRLEISGINLSEILAKICVSHGLPAKDLIPINGFLYDEQINTKSINISFLSIILRLADILDFDRERTPTVLYNSIHFTSDISVKEWEKHRGIRGWRIDKNKIQFTMKYKHPVYENVARKFLDWIDEELSECLYLCSQYPHDFLKYKLELPNNVDRSRVGPLNNAYIYYDLEFSLSRNEIVNLLMTNNLYSNPSLCIRELLQNSADAIRLRKAQFKKDRLDWNEGKILFEHFVEDGMEVLKCSDNGTGMDEHIIRNYLTKVGRSFYKSPEFMKERLTLKKSNTDFEPCSQFGIGLMSCFMIGDKIKVFTRKDSGHGTKKGKPLVININGTGGIISISAGEQSQPIGTTILIYGRKKPPFFDEWIDKVRLIATLEGYALGIEFPIEAKCLIDEIKEDLFIKPELVTHPTIIEDMGIQQFEEFTFDLQTLNENLLGEIKETFLINENKFPCLLNTQAAWEPDQNKHRKASLSLKYDNKKEQTTHWHEPISVCMDGVLVAGRPGKPNSKNMLKMGWHSSGISIHGSCIIDIRGDIKPELKPSRIPVETRHMERTPKWEKINSYIQAGYGAIWDSLAQKIDEKEFSSETFLKLGMLYSFSFLNMNFQAVSRYIQFPLVSNKGKEQWEKRNKIKKLIIKTEGKEYNLFTPNNLKVEASKNFKEWVALYTENYSIDWHIKSMLILTSELSSDNGGFVLLNKESIENKRLYEYFFSSGPFLRAYSLVYSPNLEKYLTVRTGIKTYNRMHPLAEILEDSKYLTKKTNLQKFARTFLPNIAEYINEKPTKEIFNESRWFNLLGHQYFSINWSKYHKKYAPPYYLLIEGKDVEITESDFKKWRDIKNSG